jgi:hypothetical protein
MKRYSVVFRLLVACTLASVAVMSHASFVLPSGSSPSDDLIFNFDFSSPPASPPPGHYFQIFFASVFPPTPAGTVVVDVFDDLNGVGLHQSFTAGTFQIVIDGTVSGPGVDDGLFSLGFRATSGSALLSDAPFAYAFASICDLTLSPPRCDTVLTQNVTGRLQSSDGSVPEPGSVALLGIAAAAFSLRRKNTAR